VVSRGPDLDGTVAPREPGAFAEIGAEIDILSITEGTLRARRNACGHLAASLAREARVLAGEMPDLGKLERSPRVWPEDLSGWIDSILSQIENLGYRVIGTGVSRKELVRFGRTLVALSSDAAERFARMAIQRRTGTFGWNHDLHALAKELQAKNRDGKWDGPVAVIREMNGQTRRHHKNYPNIRLTARDARLGLARFRLLLAALEEELTDAVRTPDLAPAATVGLAEYRELCRKATGFFPDTVQALPDDPFTTAAVTDGVSEETSLTDVRMARAAVRALPDMRVALASGLDVPPSERRREPRSFTPLHAAARDGDMEAMAAVLPGGGIPDSATESGIAPLHLAAARGRLEALAALLAAGADTGARTTCGSVPPHMASQAGSVEAVRLLLAEGAEVNAKDAYGFTPLHAAALAGRSGAVRRLLKAGADVHARDIELTTPLHMAAESGDAATVRALVGAGAGTGVTDTDLVTPLHGVAEAGAKKALRLLLQAGAVTEVADRDGWTPLHEAAASGRVGIMRTLLAAGADPTAQTAKGLTASDLACDVGRVQDSEMPRALKSTGDSIDDA